jgi:hypothetical protein
MAYYPLLPPTEKLANLAATLDRAVDQAVRLAGLELPPAPVLTMLLAVLQADGWRPPEHNEVASGSIGRSDRIDGRVAGRKKGAENSVTTRQNRALVRRAVVGDIMHEHGLWDHPYSKATAEKVHEALLARVARLFPDKSHRARRSFNAFSPNTIADDIEEIVRQRRLEGSDGSDGEQPRVNRAKAKAKTGGGASTG